MIEFIRAVSLVLALLNPLLVIVYLLDVVQKVDSRTFRRVLIGAGLIASTVSCCFALAGETEMVMDQPEFSATVNNAGPPVVPTVYVVGRPDRTVQPVRKTKGLTLDSVRLTETLLSESVLILRPDGTGSWGYHAGFDIFREPDFRDGRRIDPRTLVEYDKWRYDPLESVTCVGGDINLLRLYHHRAYQPALYEIAFPSPITIKSLHVASNCDGLSQPGVVVRVRLYADRQQKQVIAERLIGPEQSTKRFPVVFDSLDQNRVYLELSAEAPRGTAVDLYYTFFEAQLDTRGLKLPLLETGGNRLTFTGDPDGSHQARIVLRWTERPAAERLWRLRSGDQRPGKRAGLHGRAFCASHVSRQRPRFRPEPFAALAGPHQVQPPEHRQPCGARRADACHPVRHQERGHFLSVRPPKAAT